MVFRMVPEWSGRVLSFLYAAAPKPLRVSPESGNCFADDHGAPAEGKSHFVLPRFRSVREGGQGDGGQALRDGQLHAGIFAV